MNFKVSTLLIFISLTFSQCEHQEDTNNIEQPAEIKLDKYSFSEPHMATSVNLVLYTQNYDTAKKLAQKCFQQVCEFNTIFSSYDANSELNQLCNKPINSAHKVSNHLFTVIEHAQSVSKKTNGAFDITIGELTKNWKQPRPLSLHNFTTGKISYSDLILNSDHKTVTLTNTLKLDLGGIAKGYIADQLMLTLQQAGIKQCAVIIGGETVLADAPPNKEGWKIGIENPEQEIIGHLTLSNTAVSTSGDSYQFLELGERRISHLIDPATRMSKANRLNVTTIAPTAMQADAWATAMRILPTEKALKLTNQNSRFSNTSILLIPHKKEPIPSNSFPPIITNKN